MSLDSLFQKFQPLNFHHFLIIRSRQFKLDTCISVVSYTVYYQALTNNPKLQQNSVAMQTETDKVHAESVQKMVSQLFHCSIYNLRWLATESVY